ncbi:hypothetical protein GUITHDRAFT_112592 [Guillardia theta CCMP2712]|uniref:Uncharacterized protein n=1 Tax=Guillardia theta (strain CCMP2712) TaxID=905079 RepID=L1IYN6_GUITC|nr:hypothetical protein GUITHDRAFT_112592 [Guillardia theta CCMP2712]EKX41378.1 hypothetical protein GUITHDRAFT_112592 [Guillardia theta CCMP2712]|eukprot:XP_005828358.1 hypothetical protein GUITHDRAFT_112592 [Guillardia theta CCMP2712]
MNLYIEEIKDGNETRTLALSAKTLKTGGESPQARGGHAAVLMGSSLYIIGGANRNQEYSTRIAKFDLRQGKWKVLQGGSQRNAVVHGGMYMPTQEFYNDTWVLKEEDGSLCWLEPRQEGLTPSARNSHTATLVEGEEGAEKMVVIGGGSSSGLLLSVEIADLQDLPDKITWSKCEEESLSRISPREMHTCSLYKDFLIIFGGRVDGEEVVSSEAILIDKTSLKALVVKVESTSFKRCGHAMAKVFRLFSGRHADLAKLRDSRLILVGGLDLTAPEICAQSVEDGETLARFAHSATTVTTGGEGEVLVFGGVNFSSDLNDVVAITSSVAKE